MAVYMGGTRHLVHRVVHDSTTGPAVAGGRVCRRVTVAVDLIGDLTLVRTGIWGRDEYLTHLQRVVAREFNKH